MPTLAPLPAWLRRIAGALCALAALGAVAPPAAARADALDEFGWRALRRAAPAARAAPARQRASKWRARSKSRWSKRAWTPARRWVGGANGQVVIRLSQQRLYWGGFAFPISTGKFYSTPRGSFRVISKVHRPSWTYRGKHVPGGIAANPLGACWLGLSQPWGWRGAPIGIHGTNTPWLIGAPVSRGCIRMHNRDALWLLRTVPVGTPVSIVP